MDPDLLTYYEDLAPRYDRSRFGSSYGRFLHAQEHRLLSRWLPGGTVLDLGCGTGRLIDLATHGLDPSPAMLAQARGRHPALDLREGHGGAIPWPDRSFDAVFCLHLLMHLQPPTILTIFAECHRVLRPGGRLLVDAPSAIRRRLTGHRQPGWHGGTALDDLSLLLGPGWRPLADAGLICLPLGRIPHRLRRVLRPLDDRLGASPLRALASYRLHLLERR